MDSVDKKKTIILVISVILFIFLIAGATYAFYVWNSNKINTVVSSKCFEILYEKSDDISGTIVPSDDYTGGLFTTVKMDINPDCNIDAIGKLYLVTTEETSTNLYREGLLNYQVLKNGVVTDVKGSITGSGEIELNLGGLSKNSTPTTEYTIYVWIDNDVIVNSDINSVYYGSIKGEAIQGTAES